MEFRDMTDADWPLFVSFAEKNFVASHPIDRDFMNFWFRRSDGSWTIQSAFSENGSMAAVNMMVEAPGRIGDTRAPITWLSTIIAEEEAQKIGIGGQMLFHSHRTLPFVGCTCANSQSLPINEALGLDFPGLKMRRFVRVLTHECLKIVKGECHKLVKRKLGPLKYPENQLLKRTWSNIVPDDFNELWIRFSSQFTCVVERSFTYMNRRYLNTPYFKYHLLIIRSLTKELHGLSIVRFQSTPSGQCARIVDFIALPGSETDIWRHTLQACMEKKCLYADFIVMGTGQDRYLREAGFSIESDRNGLEGVPNLLNPIDYRSWTYTFHISGTLPRLVDNWRVNNKVWFTKGDGDRDWPTPISVAEYQINL